MSSEKPFDQLVVVGASAGGIEALSTLVSTLPSDFPAPIVIAQHLDPHRPSHLGNILAQRGTLPVRSVAERERLEPGVVYVVPSNRDVRITDSEVSVTAVNAGHPKPSIDLLFHTAARVFGERLIAVVLTGSGSDGAAGARDVKEAGGMVVIQNPETASYPGMPESLAPTTVDVVANLESIGPLLHDIVTGAYLPTQADDQRMLQAFLEQMRDNSGIDFTSYKTPTIMRRLQRRIAATSMEGLSEYIRYIQQHPEEYQRLISSFLIKVTEFFRDPDLFAYLREQMLPEMLAQARRHGNELRLWSAGCATGEEAYSLAILLAEALGDELEQYNVRIFATDLDAEAVAFARRGIYPASALSGLSAEIVARYFSEIAGEYEVKKPVRALTVFGQHDLGQRAPFPRIDLALCRNVLIYFTAELQKRALQLFAFSLRDGGYLVLGKAETAGMLGEFFASDHPQLRIYRRQGDRMLIPSARIRDTTPTPPARLVPARRTPTSLAFSRAQRESQRVRNSNERLGALVLGLAVGVVVVDRRYDIQAINNTARRLLGIHNPALGDDVIHLAQNVPVAQLRAAIDAAFRGEGSASAIVTAEMSVGESLSLQISCHAQTTEGDDGPTDVVAILVSDVTEMVRERRELEQVSTRQREESERLQSQTQRLVETNRQLLDANQELASNNLDLHSANEEFLVTNEELQAASEEVETLNEELQATNEELETLNEEMQATVEELNTTNDDLQARSMELQELAVSLEAQRRESESGRARLEAVLLSMGDAVLAVDRAGNPVLTNAAYDEMFGGAGFAARDENGQPLPAEATPQQRAARGESFSMQFVTTEPGTQVRRWFEANGQPIRGDAAEQAGVVIIRDITERSLRRLQDEFLAMASHELRTPLTPIRGYLQMLLKRLGTEGDDEKPRHYAAMALQQSERLNRLIDDLLDVTRLQTGKLSLALEPVDLSTLARRMAEVTQVMADGHTINVEAPGDTVTVNGDAPRLEQILINLLTNALRYAPDSQQIDVRLRRVDGEAELQVQDYGPGIAAGDLPNLFSRYYQVEHGRHTAGEDGGLGLGLYITRELATAHGGRIEVESTEGQGTTFTVRLPLVGD